MMNVQQGVTYEVRFKLDDSLPKPVDDVKQDRDESIIKDKTPKETKNIVKKEKEDKKRLAKITKDFISATGFVMLGVNTALNYQSTTYQISGDYLAAQRLGNVQKQFNEVVGQGIGIGAAFVLGGATGGAAALAYTAYQLGMRAIQYANDVRKYVAQIEVDLKEKSYDRERLVKNIAERR
jgi:hypothetical protein